MAGEGIVVVACDGNKSNGIWLNWVHRMWDPSFCTTHYYFINSVLAFTPAS